MRQREKVYCKDFSTLSNERHHINDKRGKRREHHFLIHKSRRLKKSQLQVHFLCLTQFFIRLMMRFFDNFYFISSLFFRVTKMSTSLLTFYIISIPVKGSHKKVTIPFDFMCHEKFRNS